MDDYKNIGG